MCWLPNRFSLFEISKVVIICKKEIRLAFFIILKPTWARTWNYLQKNKWLAFVFFLKITWAYSNQIYLVTLRPTQLTQASFLQKEKSKVAKCFFYIFNAEIAQCRQKFDVISRTKVIQFWSYQKTYLTKNVVIEALYFQT